MLQSLSTSAPVATPTPPAAAPRKRRRRAPTTGAAEDCFTCRGKGTKCDRRRPYCGPCLEVGNECGGYRTQLTWGIGVASRGKLRGQALPICIDTGEKKGIRKKSIAGDPSTPRSAKALDSPRPKKEESVSSNAGNESPAIVTNYDFVNMENPPSSSTAPPPNLMARSFNPHTNLHRQSMHIRTNTSTPYLNQVSASFPNLQQLPHQNPRSPGPIHFHRPSFSQLSTSSTSATSPLPLSPMSEYEPSMMGVHSPFTLSPTTSSTSLFEMGMAASSSFHHRPSMPTTSDVGFCPTPAHSAVRMIPNAASHTSLHSLRHQSQDDGNHWNSHPMGSPHQHPVHNSNNLSELLYSDDMLAFGEPEFQFSPPTYQNSMSTCTSAPTDIPFAHARSHMQNLSINTPPMHMPPYLANKNPHLRFLVDYYDKTVCPALVVFDTPSNPYRAHVLQLAFHNEALMEAVLALASSHLRQQGNGGVKVEGNFNMHYDSPEPAMVISPINSMDDLHGAGHMPWEMQSHGHHGSDMYDSAIDVSDNNSSVTSSLEHKNNSIRLLNSQLANQALATTDAAMATLLLLCLYHVCETGTGQFRTHLAGVKKLMGMRGIGKSLQRWTWMETVFTWLDNMSAPINNRLSQLEAMDYFGSLQDGHGDDWDLESLTGCDRYLFQKISKLSRVNMLSQKSPTNPSRRWFTSNDQEDDEWEEPVRNENDGRYEFWEAWHALKNELAEWMPSPKFAARSSRHRQTDPFAASSYQSDSGFASLASSSPNSPAMSSFRAGAANSPGQRKMSVKAQEAVENNHWLHASNVWKSAANLYLDRLAYPHLSSSHPVFQNTVRKVLDHVNCIPTTSGLSKLLFWPLFIVGSECVVDSHRALIRQRCHEMQSASGFYNKIVGLNVLEKIWNDNEDIMQDPDLDESMGGRGLRWRRVTANEEVEFLMI